MLILQLPGTWHKLYSLPRCTNFIQKYFLCGEYGMKFKGKTDYAVYLQCDWFSLLSSA
jgi:hypothetical protein